MTMRRFYGRAFVRGAIQDGTVVTVDGGRIVEVTRAASRPSDATVVDGLLAPGFVDVHIHGGAGSDFMDADPEGNRRILLHHARHGTTALAATTLSASHGDLVRAVRQIVATAAETNPAAAEVLALHLEGPFVNAARAGAQDRASIRPPDSRELEKLLTAAGLLRCIMTIAPESEGALALIERFSHRVVFSIGHTDADHAQAVAALAAGASHFTHLFNAMSGLGHRTPGVVGAALASADATAELIADGIHVHPAALRIAARTMPRQIALVTDAMRACGLPEGRYKLYGYDVTVADGAARLADGTLAGSVLTMHEAVRNMVELAGLPIEVVLPLATEVPARVAGAATRKGRIEPGFDADFTILDGRLGLERVIVRGEDAD